MDLIEKIKAFEPKKVLVAGDLILDIRTEGESTRLSPEAPVPVVLVNNEVYNPGGAGNTAVNIACLGSKPLLYGVVGQDQYGKRVIESLEALNVDTRYVLRANHVGTIAKERIISRGQHIVRVDRKDHLDSTKLQPALLDSIYSAIPNVDLLIISDYAKGTLSPESIRSIISRSLSYGKKVIVDTRPENVAAYNNASIITPNFEEAREMAGSGLRKNVENAEIIARKLYSKLNAIVFLTLSELGIAVYDGKSFRHYPTYRRQVMDVSGAGDSVSAALAVAQSNGLSLEESAIFTNHAGGVKVEKLGVQPVSIGEIIKDMAHHRNNARKA